VPPNIKPRGTPTGRVCERHNQTAGTKNMKTGACFSQQSTVNIAGQDVLTILPDRACRLHVVGFGIQSCEGLTLTLDESARRHAAGNGNLTPEILLARDLMHCWEGVCAFTNGLGAVSRGIGYQKWGYHVEIEGLQFLKRSFLMRIYDSTWCRLCTQRTKLALYVPTAIKPVSTTQPNNPSGVELY